MGKVLYICGTVIDTATPWEFRGIYTTEAAAIAQCKSPADFVGPVTLDESLDDDPQVWPGAVFPMAEP